VSAKARSTLPLYSSKRMKYFVSWSGRSVGTHTSAIWRSIGARGLNTFVSSLLELSDKMRRRLSASYVNQRTTISFLLKPAVSVWK